MEVVHRVSDFPEINMPESTDRAGFTIREAVQQMQQGRSVRRSDWQPKKHISLSNSGRWLFRQDGRRYTPTADDMLANDWETT